MAEPTSPQSAAAAMRSYIQRVATGPEYSKDIDFDEAKRALEIILDGEADPVQAGVFLIALRMKRETQEENRGALRAILERVRRVTAEVDELVEIADPYDGYARGLPAAPFLPPVIAAAGLPAVSHGVESVGPKYGISAHKVLRAAGVKVDLTPQQAAERLAHPECGWAYIDQSAFCPELYALTDLRRRIIKRPMLTTIEVLANPIRGRGKTFFYTGYVHKPYPPVYADLARLAEFDRAIIVRGVEGGVIPSLQQPADLFFYHDRGEEQKVVVKPQAIGIDRETRAVPLPEGLSTPSSDDEEPRSSIDSDAASNATAERGIEALEGKPGPTRDALIYGSALCLHYLGQTESLEAGAQLAREAIDSGAALARLRA